MLSVKTLTTVGILLVVALLATGALRLPGWIRMVPVLLIWATGSLYGAAVTGWRLLARAYPAKGWFHGRRKYMQSVLMNGKVQYRGLLNVGANTEGVRFWVILPFRIGHSPFLAPWKEVTGFRQSWSTMEMVHQGTVVGTGEKTLVVQTGASSVSVLPAVSETVQLQFARAPLVNFEIQPRLADALEEMSEGAWTYRRGPTTADLP